MTPSWYRRRPAPSSTLSASDECSKTGNAARATDRGLVSSVENSVASDAYGKNGDGRSTSLDRVGRDGVTDSPPQGYVPTPFP